MEEHKNRIGIWMPLLLALFLVIGMALGNLLQNNSARQMPLKVFAQNDKLSTVLDYIERNYVDSVSRSAITEEIIPLLLENLDPHSIYIPVTDLPAVNEVMRGNFDGIGIEFNMQSDTVLILQITGGGPSEKAGLLAGDRIIRVDGETVAGVKMDQDTIVGKIRGPRGSTVNLGIFRPSRQQELDFTITRGVIPKKSVEVAYMAAPGIGFIKITTFSKTTYPEFQEALARLRKEGCTGLILDLRGNGGGMMEPAIRISEELLEKGSLIVYTEGRARKRQEFRTSRTGSSSLLQLAVLIDEQSASAAEIIAGAIQDNDRGWIIGRRSFGKGLVQEQAVLNDGSAIRLTTARYYTPTGRSIQKSYENGLDDYYHEVIHRYGKGELIQADSIHFNDSLRFTTPQGRIVYGGGGIMPDYFVPIDTTGITPLYRRINQINLIYRFALIYADRHREELSAFTSPTDLTDYLETVNILELFKEYARSQGITSGPSAWAVPSPVFRIQLQAYVARNILDNEGFYPIIQELDKALLKALEVLQ
ncbi:MAG: S41 family peptidase [Bacteroidales bacterium]